MLSNNVRRHSLLTGASAPGSILQNSFIGSRTGQTRRKVLTFGFVHWHVEIQNFVSHDLTKVLLSDFVYLLLTYFTILSKVGRSCDRCCLLFTFGYTTILLCKVLLYFKFNGTCVFTCLKALHFSKKGILRRWSLLYALKAMQKAASIPSFVPKFNAFKSFKRLS